MQSKLLKNRSIHWTHQFASKNRVQDTSLDNKNSQKPTSELQFIELLPDNEVQEHLLTNFAIIVSRIIVNYLECFKVLRNVIIQHVPHKYKKEMATKSETVSYTIS